MSPAPVQSPLGLLVRSQLGAVLAAKTPGRRIVVLWGGFHAIEVGAGEDPGYAQATTPYPGAVRVHSPAFDASTGRPNWDADDIDLRKQMTNPPGPLAEATVSITLGVLHYVARARTGPNEPLGQVWLMPSGVPFPYDIMSYSVGQTEPPIVENEPFLAVNPMPAEAYLSYVDELAPDGFDYLIIIQQIPFLSVGGPTFAATRTVLVGVRDTLQTRFPDATIGIVVDATGPRRRWLSQMRISLAGAMP